MRFLHNVIGPDFDKADLVSFDFGDVDFIMRLPENSDRDGEKFLAPSDLTCITDDQWDITGDSIKTLTLAKHRWVYKYDDPVNEIDSFLTDIYLVVKEIPAEKQTQPVPLNINTFSGWILEMMHHWIHLTVRDMPTGEPFEVVMKNWQAPATVADMEIIKRDNLDWVVAPYGPIDNGPPVQHICIPLNRKYFMMLMVETSKMYYADLADPFLDKEIELVEAQICDEFLSYINIVYSPEILEAIKKQRS
ncbi:MAG: hypothetical protein OEZ39_17785 [Gammaproteobacteria bacterium]|nr:hypothetical protein [Gammaproteobacteria bacterium]MDH5653717.1 hypothetical protein [Gammaproteobacteria bacterium]